MPAERSAARQRQTKETDVSVRLNLDGGGAIVPLDESRATVAVDCGGRGYAMIDLPLRGLTIGSLPATMVPHFLETFALRGGVTLHVVASGRDDHHLAEATFKALACALRQACAVDPALRGKSASTK